MYGEIEYDYKCERCDFLTNDPRDISLCNASDCARVDLCPDHTYTCDLCAETFCRDHVVIVPGGTRREDIICHACAARIVAVAA